MITLRKNTWWVDIPASMSPTGKRLRRSAKTKDREEALVFAQSILRREQDVLKAVTVVTLRSVMDEVLAEYWQGMASYSANKVNCKDICKCIPPSTPISELSGAHLRELEKGLRAKGNKESTINRKRATLSKVLNKAVEWEYIDRIPKIQFGKENPGRERVLSPEEETALLATCLEFPDKYVEGKWLEMAKLIECLIDTGARLGEMLKLTPKHVCLDKRLITFHWSTTKGKRTRSIPMTERVAANMQDFIGWTLNKDAVESRWRVLRAALSLENDKEFVPHCLRHTCATRLLQGGLTLHQVSRWLGHSSTTTTDRYSHLVTSLLSDGVDILEVSGITQGKQSVTKHDQSVTRSVTNCDQPEAISISPFPSLTLN